MIADLIGVGFGDIDINKIYLGQSVIYEKESGPDYLCFTAISDDTNLSMTGTAASGGIYAVNLEYSSDKINWTTYERDTEINLNTNQKVYFRGINTKFASGSTNYNYFVSDSDIKCSGNIMTLIDGVGTSTELTESYAFYRLFYNCPIVTAPYLPATILSANCYRQMFYGCQSLVTPARIDATNMGSNTFCCYQMFYNCKELTKLPKLLTSNLPASSYLGMFQMCSKIKISETRTDEYTNEFRIPFTGDGTAAAGALTNMFASTGGTFTGLPIVNTTYYTSNEII